MNERNDIGFLGLGLMGSAMAERLLADDINLHVFDPDSRAIAPFREHGAIVHHSPQSVADVATITIASLPSPSVSAAVAFGEHGVVHGSAVRFHVEMSTIGRDTVEQIALALASRNISVVDAPVSGGPKGARAGRLAIMAAGDSRAMAAVEPWLRRIAETIFHVDERPGRGQVMKLVNNLISGAVMASTFETLVLGVKAGLDPDVMLSVLNASSARNSATLQKVPDAILPGTFDFGASIRTFAKDMELGLAEGRALNVPLWAGEAIGQIWRFALSQRDPEEDYTTLIRFMEAWAGVEVRSTAKRNTMVA
jgi:3-hydroxyisobutyrate dehydrogenase